MQRENTCGGEGEKNERRSSNSRAAATVGAAGFASSTAAEPVKEERRWESGSRRWSHLSAPISCGTDVSSWLVGFRSNGTKRCDD
jgi:hypothetical protein